MDQPLLVLVIDDEANFLEILKAKLTAAGLRVETAENGREGIQKAKALKPDLILMDVKMPEMDGIAAVSELKRDPETKDLKIIFLTNLGEAQADMQEIDEKFSLNVGAMGYIKKTDDLDSIVQRVKSFLAR